MAWIAALLILAAIALIAWGIRGRIVGVGEFCAQCRFDLAGIDLDNKFAECPECGRRVSDIRARIATRRAVSRSKIAIGAVMLVLAAPVLALRIAGGVGAIYPHLADRHVAYAARWGDEAALDEFVTRLSVGSNIDPGVWDPMIDHALDHQGDRTEPWDPRWGEVLARAVVARAMSDADRRRYTAQGIDVRLLTRDIIRPDMTDLPYRIEFEGVRLSTTSYVSSPLKLTVGFKEVGLGQYRLTKHFGSVYLPMRDGPMHGIMQSFFFPRRVIEGHEGQLLDANAEIVVSTMYRDEPQTRVGHSVSRSRPVRVVNDDVALVELVRYGIAPLDVAEMLDVSCVRIAPSTRKADLISGSQLLSIRSKVVNPTVTVAARVTALVDDDRLEIGSLVFKADTSREKHQIFGWGMWDSHTEHMERVRQALIAQGTIDLEIITDPALALDRIGIDRVQAVNFVLRDIPVCPAGDDVEGETDRDWPLLDSSAYEVEVLGQDEILGQEPSP